MQLSFPPRARPRFMTSLEDSEEPTPEQRDAAESSERVVAILAGPGSGKTRTLCDRARFLLESDGDASVLLLTFMNKAAAEMKARALAATKAPSHRLLASTYHTFGLRILDTNRELLGIEEIDILDAQEAEDLVTEEAEALGLERPDGWHWRLSRRRLRDLPLRGDLSRLAANYAGRKKDLGVVDFDDLLVLSADLLAEHDTLAESWALRYPHVLIDEFQDTNAVQFRLVRALAQHATTVSVVADDDQAIMGFAGADSGNVRTFVSELGAVVYPLSVNHRCRRRVVEAANQLIRCDPLASQRQMEWRRDGGSVEVSAHFDLEAEAGWLVREVNEVLTMDGVEPRDLAVLARTGPRTDVAIRALRNAGLPVNDWRTSWEAHEARAYLVTSLAFLRARLSPRQRLRASELLGLSGEAEETFELLDLNVGTPVADELIRLRDDAFQGMSPSEIVHRVALIVEDIDETQAEAISAVAGQIEAFEEHDPEFSTEHLLDHLALGAPAHGAPTESGGIKVATLHRTKGLEWPHVWILGLEDDTLPFYLAKDDPDDVRDERRLFFVGICRAEDSLRLSRVGSIKGWTKTPSRFLTELGL